MECFEKLEIVRDFISEITRERDLGQLLHHLTGIITRLTRADRSSLFLYDEKRDEIWTMIAEGIGHEIRVPVDKSIAGGAIREGRLQVVHDVSDDIRFNAGIDKKTGYETKNILAYPLYNSTGKLVGVIEVINKLEGAFEEDDINALKLFSSFISYVLENKFLNEHMENVIKERTETIQQLNRELEEKIEVVTRISETDALTGIYNRLKIDRLFCETLTDVQREQGTMGLILFDIDNFKGINDTYGHLKGDEVLVAVAHAVSGVLEADVHFGRWGGEEFLVVLPGASRDESRGLAERLRRIISELTVPEVGQVTCSFGVTIYSDGMDSDALIQEADRAMYRAKEEGKNRVVAL